MPKQQPAACDDDTDDAWFHHSRAALAHTIAEPLLAVCPFVQADTTGNAGGVATHLVLVITPTTVHAYARRLDGEIDMRSQLAAWSRRSLSATVARNSSRVTLRLSTHDRELIELQASGHARVDAFVRLIEHSVCG